MLKMQSINLTFAREEEIAKLTYFGHIMRTQDSLEKIMLAKTESSGNKEKIIYGVN